MFNNKFLKALSSIPIILVALYFIPFLGICLIILRCFVYTRDKIKSIAIWSLVLGIILLIPKLVDYLISSFKLDFSIPYLQTIMDSTLYADLLSYSKYLLVLGVILIIISQIFKSIFDKLQNIARSYIQKEETMHREVAKENDLQMKIKQEKAKNTSVIICPYCGADNIVSTAMAKCKYCRRSLENKEDNGIKK